MGHAPTPPSLIPGCSVSSPAPPKSHPKPGGGLSIPRSISVLQCATFPQRQGVSFLLRGSSCPTGSRLASSPFPHGSAARHQPHLSQLLSASPLQSKPIPLNPPSPSSCGPCSFRAWLQKKVAAHLTIARNRSRWWEATLLLPACSLMAYLNLPDQATANHHSPRMISLLPAPAAPVPLQDGTEV